MERKTNRHFLIVGAGLSGVMLSYQLLKKKQRVSLIDNGVNHSSIVAAGMINPLVFRRMTKSWRADEFIPYLEDLYPELEEQCESSFFFPINSRRLFSSEQEREFWLKRELTPEYREYMFPITPEDDQYSAVINEFGSGRVKHVSYIETTVFLKSMLHYLEQAGVELLHEQMDYSGMDGTVYNGVKYDDIVFCEGYLGKNNPWFGQLPLNQTMGETLLIRSTSLPEDTALNRKCFVLPKGEHTFKIGSTYHWHNGTPVPTDKGCSQILENLGYLTTEEVEVLEKDAGVRPTTYDRRPLIGTHESIPAYHIFNGLGTKGYMIAPLLSKEFADYLVDSKPLHEEVDISRTYHGR